MTLAIMMPNTIRAVFASVAFLAALPSALSQAHGEEASQEMGPVAFMWPPDREWGAAQDNHAPCGSHQGVENRTEFPLSMLSSVP